MSAYINYLLYFAGAAMVMRFDSDELGSDELILQQIDPISGECKAPLEEAVYPEHGQGLCILASEAHLRGARLIFLPPQPPSRGGKGEKRGTGGEKVRRARVSCRERISPENTDASSGKRLYRMAQ